MDMGMGGRGKVGGADLGLSGCNFVSDWGGGYGVVRALSRVAAVSHLVMVWLVLPVSVGAW